jgi:hypothetical protein
MSYFFWNFLTFENVFFFIIGASYKSKHHVRPWIPTKPLPKQAELDLPGLLHRLRCGANRLQTPWNPSRPAFWIREKQSR